MSFGSYSFTWNKYCFFASGFLADVEYSRFGSLDIVSYSSKCTFVE